MRIAIDSLTADEALRHRTGLSAVLRDAVDSGASVGFLAPLAESEADDYWQTVVAMLRVGSCVLLVARTAGGDLVGSAQLILAMRPNALHRAEVAKVMVHTKARRCGIGRALMLALEAHAGRLGRTTLVLDTRQGDPSERLYTAVGYRMAGAIPEYARSADRSLDPSAFYYRLLRTKEANRDSG